jgi:hypothetical protein
MGFRTWLNMRVQDADYAERVVEVEPAKPREPIGVMSIAAGVALGIVLVCVLACVVGGIVTFIGGCIGAN